MIHNLLSLKPGTCFLFGLVLEEKANISLEKLYGVSQIKIGPHGSGVLLTSS